jgi:Na+-transporting methylmalonyl-CoA/oxaloacetate decarboxylase gamma subunit
MLAGALILVHVMRWVGLVLSRFLQEQNRRPRLNGAATAADGESTAAGESARNG